ncbi:MAG: NADH-quinone oxidoreductase subunit J [Chloroflexi bacterium]|nr:NADH-quinone oxidoreductase subunit J [Chloroflexota bacterium]
MIITASLVLFYVAGAITLGGALVVVMSRNIVYAAFGLLASMVGVAGLFLIALAEFLALAQLLIYGGAVVIVILFALMLTRIEDFENLSDHPQWPIAAVVAIAVFGVIAATIIGTAAPESERVSLSFTALGSSLFTEWAIAFEVASLILLVALIGAVVMVRTSRGRD